MELRTLLTEQIGRERTYLLAQEVGTDEYNDSTKRLNALEDKLFDLEKFEFESAKDIEQAKDEKKDKWTKNAIEILKIIVQSAVTVGGLAAVLAFEKNDTITSVMKGWLNLLIPKKN